MTERKEGSSRPTTPLRCSRCGGEFARAELVRVEALRPSLRQHLREAVSEEAAAKGSRICRSCLSRTRYESMMARLQREKGELSAVEQEIARKASLHETIAADLGRRFSAQTTFGQRIADRVAAVGGSWPFVLGFFVVLLAWIAVNSFGLQHRAFDPYPYILLNLLLSCLAAVQAPIIMMAQNRVAARDRMQADHDFQINLKAELEISSLHEKIDHLLHSQWQEMVEIQEMQIELLEELLDAKRR